MKTLAEESLDYSSQVQTYLDKHGQKRLPWGSIVSGGHLTFNTTSSERIRRAELGEVAIALLEARGVSLELLERVLETTPWNSTPAWLERKAVELRFEGNPVGDIEECDSSVIEIVDMEAATGE